jgi:hypothetical protein
VTMNPESKIWKEGAILIKGDRIGSIGPQDDLLKSYPIAQKISGVAEIWS